MKKPSLPFRFDRDRVQVVLLWLAYVVAIEVVGYVVVHDPSHRVAGDFQIRMEGMVGPADTLPVLCRWDCAWYVSIAERGYPGAGHASLNTSFFPFYGLSMRAVSSVTHLSAVWSGAWISRFALLGTLLLLFEVGRDLNYGAEQRWGALVALLFSPDAFTMLAVYADGLFLFLSLAAFALTLRGRPGWGAVPALLAGITRVHGLALIVGLAALGWWQHRRGRNGRLPMSFLPAVACAAAIASLLVYLRITTHDAFIFTTNQAYFGKSASAGPFALVRELRVVWKTIIPPQSIRDFYGAWHIPYTIAIWAVMAYFARTKRWVELAYTAAAYGLSVVSGTNWCALRYAAEVFPIWYAVSALLRWRAAWVAYLMAGLMSETLLLMNFVSLRPYSP